MEHLRFEVDGVGFHALTAGPTDGHLVILAHGFPDAAASWTVLLRALAEQGYFGVALAMRGYAPTEVALEIHPEPARLGLDLLRTADHFAPGQPCSLIGHDWGAIAAYAASQIAPERIDRMITMAVPPMPAVMRAMEDPAQVKRSWYLFAFQEEGYEHEVTRDEFALIRRLWADWSPGLDAKDYVEHAIDAIGDRARTTAALNYYRTLLDPTRRDPALGWADARLRSSISVPTLYLHGRQDGCIGLESIGAIHHLLPEGSSVEVFENAGHFLHLEEPDRTARLVLEHLRRSRQAES